MGDRVFGWMGDRVLGGWAIGFLGGWAIGFLVDGRSGFWIDGRSGFLWMGDRFFCGWAIGFFVDGRSGFCGWAIGFFCGWGRSGYNTENLTTKMTVMRELIQQELEKFDREQLQQVFEFIEQLSLSQESASDRSRQKTELETTFYQLAEQWKSETRGISSTEQMSVHPAYQQIIGMGRDVIPLLLRELENNSGRWFWALKSISREEPVTPEQRGKTKEMIAAWLNWGREKGYKW